MEEVSLDPPVDTAELLIAGLIEPILEAEIHTRGVIDDHHHRHHIQDSVCCLPASE